MSNNYRITGLVGTLVRYLDIRKNALMLLSASTVKAGTLAASIFYVYLLYSKLEAGSYAYLSLILLVANFLMLLSNILRDLSFVTLKVSGRLPYLDLCILSYIYGFLIIISMLALLLGGWLLNIFIDNYTIFVVITISQVFNQIANVNEVRYFWAERFLFLSFIGLLKNLGLITGVWLFGFDLWSIAIIICLVEFFRCLAFLWGVGALHLRHMMKALSRHKYIRNFLTQNKTYMIENIKSSILNQASLGAPFLLGVQFSFESIGQFIVGRDLVRRFSKMAASPILMFRRKLLQKTLAKITWGQFKNIQTINFIFRCLLSIGVAGILYFYFNLYPIWSVVFGITFIVMGISAVSRIIIKTEYSPRQSSLISLIRLIVVYIMAGIMLLMNEPKFIVLMFIVEELTNTVVHVIYSKRRYMKVVV